MSAPEPRAGLAGTVVRGVSFAGSGFVLARGITFASYIALARLITPEELGQFAAGSILVGIGILFAGSGMAAAVIHRRDRLEEAAATAVIATALAGVGLAAIAVASAPLLGFVFDSEKVAAVAAAMAGVLFLNSARVIPNALLQRRFSFLRRLVVEPASALAFGAGAIIATSEGMGVWGLVVGQYASAVTDFLLSWALVRWRPRLSLASVGTWRELLSYGRHVLAGSAVRRLGDRIPIVAAGSFVGSAALGQYQVANRLVSTPFALLVAGVSYVVFPAFARISDERERFRAAYLRSLRWMSFLAMAIGFLLLPLGEPLTVLTFGAAWEEAGEATVALALLVPARAITAVVSEAFKGSGQPSERTRVNVAGVIAGAVAMVPLVPALGLMGVALAVTADAVVGACYAVHRARGALAVGLATMLRRIAEPVLAGVAMAIAVLALDQLVVDAASRGVAAGLPLLAGEALAGIGVYALVLRVVCPGAGDDLRSLRSSARRGRPASAGESLDSAGVV